MSQQTTAPAETGGKTHTDTAHLLRAIERGIVYDRLPAPINISMQPEYGSVKLRFATADDVREWETPTGATVVVGPHVFHRSGTDAAWHEVGTEQGGREGQLAGWRVAMWASVDGLPPAPEPEGCPCLDQPEPAEVEQEWLFTFGTGQQHDGRFVRITGTHDSARARMVEVFGTAWCDQYDWRRFDQLGLLAELVELPEAVWPQRTEQADDAAEQPKLADDGRCVACRHEAEHRWDRGCEARDGYGQRCGCTHVPAGV